MKYPRFLPKNGTIGFIAPSFGCNIEPYRSAFANSLKTWNRLGFRYQLGPNVYEGTGIGISSTPERCGREINECYTSPESDVLISCGGGELMCEDLDYVDFDRLRGTDPKWFMGYSDNTNLTFLLTTLCDTAAVYGPCAPAFGMEPWHPALQDAADVLTGAAVRIQDGKQIITMHGYEKYETESRKDEEHPLEPYHVTEPCRRIGYPGQQAVCSGRLLGGCLDILVNLIGTRYDKVSDYMERYREDGILWFLEACDLNMMSIRRAIWQMDAAGWFRYARGVLVGRPYHHKTVDFGLDQYHAVTDLLAKYGIPVIMDLDIGHIPPMMPLVLGSYATATLDGNEFTLDMELRP